jgi:hypothetical protein
MEVERKEITKYNMVGSRRTIAKYKYPINTVVAVASRKACARNGDAARG